MRGLRRTSAVLSGVVVALSVREQQLVTVGFCRTEAEKEVVGLDCGAPQGMEEDGGRAAAERDTKAALPLG